jgi:thiol-disulfide isomerase/thioredoxin
MKPIVILSFLALSACATQDEVKKLEDRIAQLEKQQQAAPSVERGKGPAGAAQAAGDPVKEEAARALYSQIQEMVGKGDFDGAKAKMSELTAQYSDTTTARRAASLNDELAVVGKEAPSELKVSKWFQGEGDVDLRKGATLLVFWEVWCPHCKREVPKLEETYAKYKGKGFQVVGLTKVTKSATDEKVQEFMTESKVDYPIAKETGEMSDYFAVRGIPAAAVVKDGKVVWRGHPARLTDEMINGWL